MEQVTQTDFLAAFGITEPPADPPTDPPTEPPADPPSDPPTDPPVDPPSDPPVDPPKDSPEDPPAAPPAKPEEKPDKAAQAFAQMRVENSTYKQTLNQVAKILGITEVKDPVALSEAIKAKALESQAKQENIPVEILQKLDRLEKMEEKFETETRKTQSAIGFQTVKDKFNLDEKKLIEFAQSLLDDGINPHEQDVDLVAEYRSRNFDTLLKEAEDRGRAAEAARIEKAKNHGSDPGDNNGNPPGAQEKISTVKDLDKYFNEIN